VADLPREAANVAEVYAQLSHDIRAYLTRLIDAAGLAGNTGMRQQAGDWPQKKPCLRRSLDEGQTLNQIFRGRVGDFPPELFSSSFVF
jgi:hypothetical protein